MSNAGTDSRGSGTDRYFFTAGPGSRHVASFASDTSTHFG